MGNDQSPFHDLLAHIESEAERKVVYEQFGRFISNFEFGVNHIRNSIHSIFRNNGLKSPRLNAIITLNQASNSLVNLLEVTMNEVLDQKEHEDEFIFVSKVLTAFRKVQKVRNYLVHGTWIDLPPISLPTLGSETNPFTLTQRMQVHKMGTKKNKLDSNSILIRSDKFELLNDLTQEVNENLLIIEMFIDQRNNIDLGSETDFDKLHNQLDNLWK